MLLAHKIELRPTLEQAAYLNQACGARRHCYNRLLSHFKQEGVKWWKAAAYQHYAISCMACRSTSAQGR